MAVDTNISIDDSVSGHSMAIRWLRPGWPLYAVLALLAGAYLGLNQRIDNSTIAPWKPFVWEYSSVVVFVALIPLVVRLERRFPVDARPH